MVIGLQSTGEARTADVVAERGELLDDYVSGPRVSHHACITFIFISCLTVWGVEPVVTHTHPGLNAQVYVVTSSASTLLLHVASAAVSCAGSLLSQLENAGWIHPTGPESYCDLC